MVTPEKRAILVDGVQKRLGGAILGTAEHRGEVTHVVTPESLREACLFLRDDESLRMDYLVDLFGVDYPSRTPRFEVVYQLYSISRRHRIRLKIRVDEGVEVPSVVEIWPAARWPEQETYDMYGIQFADHSGLRRIYMGDEWEGYPLRKDYPLRGYKDQYNPEGEEREEPLP